MTVLVEACVETAEAARQAQAAGAGRVELCSNLDVGGTTPDLALVAAVRQLLVLPLHVLIRPRGGDFRYAGDEIAGMLQDIAAVARLGADGVVIGALDAAARVDRTLTRELMEAAHPMAVTFHRAFDRARDPVEAAETLRELGLERVLTSGCAPSAEAGIPVLTELVRRSGASLTILAAGGIREHNARRLVEQTGVAELHLRAGPAAEWITGVLKALADRFAG
jgi:copper homeostasis protein